MRPISTAAAPNPVAAYSQGAEAGGVVYTAGQLGFDAGSAAFPADIETQTLNALTNVRAIIEAAGCRVEDIVKVNVFLMDMAQFDAMNEVYKRFFGGHKPARSTVGVAALPRPGALIEIDAVASK